MCLCAYSYIYEKQMEKNMLISLILIYRMEFFMLYHSLRLDYFIRILKQINILNTNINIYLFMFVFMFMFMFMFTSIEIHTLI